MPETCPKHGLQHMYSNVRIPCMYSMCVFYVFIPMYSLYVFYVCILHPSAEEELRRLAGLARDRLIERGIRPAAFLRRWRHQMLAALARSTAFALLYALNLVCRG